MSYYHKRYIRLPFSREFFILKKLSKIVFGSFAVMLAFLFYVLKGTVKFVKYVYHFIVNSKYLSEIGISYSKIEELIKNMTGREFEIFMAEVFKAFGYDVTLTDKTNDEGKDIILYHPQEGKTYVECKRWIETGVPIGREVLQKLVGSATADKIENTMCVTTGKYNKNAKEYAKKINSMQLYSMTDIMIMVTSIDIKKLHRILIKTLNDNIKIIKLKPCKQ